ncbi:hypothetical protein PN467_15090 [Microcystis aeruginosa CS-563/04]|nr:hypothetical protein [Microcystis aeruginosa]MDB9421800.1 hypothetical protein [Microcystis aeruginosa CS-563/04]
MTPSKSVKPYTLHPTPYTHEKLFQQTLTTSCMSASCMSAYPNQEVNFALLLSSLNVIKASRGESAQSKERKKHNQENFPVHSFRTLLADLGKICLNTVECTIREGSYCFSKITRPTSLQQSCVGFIGGFHDTLFSGKFLTATDDRPEIANC